MKDVCGVFGGNEIKERGGTIGSNPTGGMDLNEFEKYLITNMSRLYPDAHDVKRLRVIILAFWFFTSDRGSLLLFKFKGGHFFCKFSITIRSFILIEQNE